MKYSVTGRYWRIAGLGALLGLLVLWVALSLSGRHMTGSAGLPVAKPSGGAASGYERLPLGFEPNRGQALASVRYVAHGAGSVVALTDHGALLRLASSKAGPGGELGIGFVAGSRPLALVAQQGLRGKVNYLIGNDRSRWHTGIPTFGSVLARRVWPGIDAVFTGDQRRLRYDFRLAPGADAGRIWVAFAGARYVRVDRDGGLAVGVAGRVVRQPRPSAYQLIAGERRAVAVNYVVSHGRLGVSLGGYDHRQPLVIDPTLDYSTYLGGSGGEYCGTATSPPAGACIAIHEGHAYITGTTDSTDFPTMPGAYQSAHGGGTGNAFVSKFTPDGSALEYSTYIAGTHCCYVWDRSIAVDSTGAAYITGTTNQDDFPTSPGAYINTSATAPYVSKLSPDGSSLDYSTYLCDTSSVNWTGMAIAVDSTGHAYVGGHAGLAGNEQAFVDKLNTTGSALDYQAIFGGVTSNRDDVFALALDSSNNVYATGSTYSTDFPTTPGAFQPSDPTSASNSSAFVIKLDSSGNTVYSTYLAGDSFDLGTAIAVDSSRAAYVTGETQSTTFPTTPGAYQRSRGPGITSAFVTKLSPDGALAEYSTYLGGNAVDIGRGIAIDGSRRAIVVGETHSTDFPATAGALQRTPPSTYAAFVIALDPQGSGVAYATYVGDATVGSGLALDSSGGVYLGGNAQGLGGVAGGLPTTPGAYQTSLNGPYSDAFVAKFHPVVVLGISNGGSSTGTVTSLPGNISCGSTCTQEFTLNNNTPVRLSATPASGSTFAGWGGACSGTGPCTVTMSSDQQVTATFTGSSTPPQTTPQLTDFKLTPTRFRAAGRGGSLARKPTKKPPIGTTVSYRDTQTATTTLTVQRATTGVKQGNRCVGRTKKNRHHKNCTRWIGVKGSFTHRDRAGPNSFKFTGRLSRKKLLPGSYRLYARPTIGTRAGKAVWAAFTIAG